MIDLFILIFTYIPSFLIHLVVIWGIMGIFISFFGNHSIFGFSINSFVSIQTLKYVSIVILVLGLYLEGGLAVNNEYLQRSSKWTQDVKLAEERGQTINENIKRFYEAKLKDSEQVKIVTQEKIREKIKVIDSCQIDKEVIDIHNYAAKGLVR